MAGFAGAERFGNWRGFRAMTFNLRARMKASLVAQLKKEGMYLESQMKKGIQEQAPGGKPFPPLHPFTIAMKTKGGRAKTQRLINSMQLVKSITSKLVSEDEMFVGLLRTSLHRRTGASGKTSYSLANIGMIQEYGAVIPADTKSQKGRRVRAWLNYNGLHLKASTVAVRIPPAPFVGPTADAEREGVQKRLAEAAMAPLLGAR